MKRNDILEDILIEKLIFGGVGLGHLPDGKAVLVSGGVIPQSRVSLRILKSRKNHVEGQLLSVNTPSPLERTIPEHWQVYGGCKWLPIPYEVQLDIKSAQVREALSGLGDHIADTVFHPIVPSPQTEGYRNKVEFSWGKYISHKEGVHEDFVFGFHKQGEFDRIVDCRYCVLADETVNAIFQDMKEFSRSSGLPTYDQKTRDGFWRHLVMRQAEATHERMMIVSVNTNFAGYTSAHYMMLVDYFTTLQAKYPELVSIYLLHNTGLADIVDGRYEHILGKTHIEEHLLGLAFDIHPRSFFQTNSYSAELLYTQALDLLHLDAKIGLDLYAGTGTIGCLLARKCETVYSVEIVSEASQAGEINARKNGIENIHFYAEPVEDFVRRDIVTQADVIVTDPPRSGMHPSAVPTLLTFEAKEWIYVSCNPATLARDLDMILTTGKYRITDVVPVDMFPHTHHIETVVRLAHI